MQVANDAAKGDYPRIVYPDAVRERPMQWAVNNVGCLSWLMAFKSGSMSRPVRCEDETGRLRLDLPSSMVDGRITREMV